MSAFVPVEHLSSGSSREAMTDVLLVCDHARNAVPPEIGTLGLGPEDMGRHIAFDVGARGVTLGLAQRLGAGAVLSTFSRLVIDPNRGEDDPTLVMRLYDGSIVPGNRRVTHGEIERRLERYHRPYHGAIEEALDAIEDGGGTPVLVSIHSFTPRLRGRGLRPWHVGVLWDRDDRLVRPMLDRLRAEPDLSIGDNEPYSGQLRGDCMWRHGTCRGLPHVLLEIRNDLIRDHDSQAEWAARLAPMIRGAVGAMRAGGDVPAASPAADNVLPHRRRAV